VLDSAWSSIVGFVFGSRLVVCSEREELGAMSIDQGPCYLQDKPTTDWIDGTDSALVSTGGILRLEM